MSRICCGLLLLLAGCPKKEVIPEPLPPALPEAPPLPPTGQLSEGIYRDDQYGFQFPIPEGWTPTVPLGDQTLRLSLSDPTTGATLEVHAVVGYLSLPPHPDCRWRFLDVGHYEGIEPGETPAPGEGETMVAHCTPNAIGAPRRIISCRQHNNLTLCIEGQLPTGTLAQFHGLPGELLRTLK